jgi:integrase
MFLVLFWCYFAIFAVDNQLYSSIMGKQSVTLRRRTMPSGNVSLYLCVYQQGARVYEYLHLYLIPERNRKDREQNRQTLQLAEAIAAKRLVEVRNGEYGFHERSADLLFDYLRRIAATKTGSTRRRYNALLAIVKSYERRKSMLVADITTAWFNGFVAYLDARGLATNTKAVYIATMRYCINEAWREGLLAANPIAGVRGAGYEETSRTYLTVDEVRRLAATPCDNDVTKRAFLFGCFTGLRHCDIRALTWGDVTQLGEFTRIIYKQAKTHGQEYLDISEQAAALMGERQRDDTQVFPLMHWSSVRKHLLAWVKRAKLNKHVTFHASRHTFAVMMLGLNTDIYTVSKLLGHRDVSTTQVYAHVLDKAKREAVAKIPSVLTREE